MVNSTPSIFFLEKQYDFLHGFLISAFLSFSQEWLFTNILSIHFTSFIYTTLTILQIPYFHAMFTNGMKESTQEEIHLDEKGETIDSNAFEALINFAYSGKVTIRCHSMTTWTKFGPNQTTYLFKWTILSNLQSILNNPTK